MTKLSAHAHAVFFFYFRQVVTEFYVTCHVTDESDVVEEKQPAFSSFTLVFGRQSRDGGRH